MNEHHEDRAQAMFVAALELPEHVRDSFLDQACHGDEDLRRQLDRLLRLHVRAEQVLRDPEDPRREQPGDQIGRFQLLWPIGEGGFGTVWVAEQREPVVRRVALKVLKAGMDTTQVIGRFQAERQALAMMDHPNIAKVFDGGATPLGRPYFVMELVDGVPITRYCDEANLTPEQRLELFVTVCQAVQHAHQKGVIHRDLTPSNVLVTSQDGRPVPKVIDFGIAKATRDRLTDRTVITGFRQLLGTPEYMSPEQADPQGVDVDTRADVYSLGVLLYELLTGTRPFELTNLFQAGYAEVLRTIREVDPPMPSTRISTLGDRLFDVAKQRHVHPRSLGTRMRGDLDWIVMKALEKEVDRRYETATALADDVLRHLAHEPVRAGPPHRIYRMRKYVRRHRVGVLAGSAIGIAMLAGGIVAALGYVEALEQNRRACTAEQQAHDERAAAILARDAEARQKEAAQAAEAVAERARAAEQRQREAAEEARAAERAQRERAEERESAAVREASKSAHLVDLLQQMLAGSNPTRAKGRDYTVRQLLDEFAAKLQDQLAVEPEVQLALRRTIARSYLALGLTERAAPQIEQILAMAAKLPPLEAPEAAQVEALQADYLLETGRLEAAIDAYGALVSRYQGRLPDTESDNWRRQMARSAGIRGDLEAAVRILEALASDIDSRAGDQRLALSMAQQFLSIALMERNHGGDLVRAEALARTCLESQREVLPTDHYSITYSMNGLATALGHLGRWQEARSLLQDVLERDVARYGPDHVHVAEDKLQLGHALYQLGQLSAAEPLIRQAVATLARTPGNPLDLASAFNELGGIHYLQGHYSDAIDAWTEALVIRSSELGDHDSVARSLQNLAVANVHVDKMIEARSLLEKSLAMRVRLHGEHHIEVANARLVLGELLVRIDGLEAAEAELRSALAVYEDDLPAGHSRFADVRSNLADCLHRMGRIAEAIEQAEAALTIGRTSWPPNARGAIKLLTLLGHARWQIGELPAAESRWEELVGRHTQNLGATHPTTLSAKHSLVQVVLDQGEARGADAARLADELVHATRQRPDAPATEIAPLLLLRAEALQLSGHTDAAEEDLQEALRLCREAPPHDPALAQSLLACGEYLLARSRRSEAEPLLRASFDLAAPQGPMSIQRWSAASALGGALLRKDRFAEAEPLLVEAVAKLPFAMTMPEARARRRTLQRLVELYECWGKPGQAAAWREELATESGTGR